MCYSTQSSMKLAYGYEDEYNLHTIYIALLLKLKLETQINLL